MSSMSKTQATIAGALWNEFYKQGVSVEAFADQLGLSLEELRLHMTPHNVRHIVRGKMIHHLLEVLGPEALLPDDNWGPRHQHDCSNCVFMGQFDWNDPMWNHKYREYDLYYCDKNWPDVIARASSTPSDYSSKCADARAFAKGLRLLDAGALFHGALKVCRLRAIALGLFEQIDERVEYQVTWGSFGRKNVEIVRATDDNDALLVAMETFGLSINTKMQAVRVSEEEG